MKEAFSIVTGIFSFMWNTSMQVFGTIGSMLFQRSIRKGNKSARKVLEEKNFDVKAVLQNCPVQGKLVVAGCDAGDAESGGSWRNEIAAFAALTAHQKGSAVVVLHRGNADLMGRLSVALGPALQEVNASAACYDPCIGMDDSRITDFLTDPCMESGLNNPGKAYLRALALFIEKRMSRSPILKLLLALAEMPLSKLMDELDMMYSEGKVTSAERETIKRWLEYGVPEQIAVYNYLENLMKQLSSVCVNSPMSEGSITSMHRIAETGRVLALDVRSITNYKRGYGLLVSELMDAVALGTKPYYLILDDVRLQGNTRILETVQSRVAGLGLCIIARDLYGNCGGVNETFESISGTSDCTFLLRQTNASTAKKWEEAIGSYKKTEQNRTITSGSSRRSPFQLFAGSSNSSGIVLNEVWEPRVPAMELSNLQEGEVYILNPGNGQIIHTAMKSLVIT